MELDSRKVVEHAVKGMLPKNKLQEPRLRRLKVYPGSEHPHTNHFNQKEN
jgi:large subunit ribosomal protein L13